MYIYLSEPVGFFPPTHMDQLKLKVHNISFCHRHGTFCNGRSINSYMYLAWGGEYLLSSPKSDTYSKKTVVLIQTKGLEHVAKYLRITTTWSNNKHITDYCSRGNWSICITGWIISMFAGADKRRAYVYCLARNICNPRSVEICIIVIIM